jgi:hypothetical protein
MSSHPGIRAERLVAKRYEEDGYAVTLDPPPSMIPFSLGTYRPDLLATKDQQHLIVEVKVSGSQVNDPGPYLKLAQEVERHDGWKFLLVTVPRTDLQEPASGASDHANLDSIRSSLRKIDGLLKLDEFAALALPHLWGIYVTTLKLDLARGGATLPNGTDLGLLHKAYSEGVISDAEHQQALRLLSLRNTSMHDLDVVVTPNDCWTLRTLVDDAVARLEQPMKHPH